MVERERERERERSRGSSLKEINRSENSWPPAGTRQLTASIVCGVFGRTVTSNGSPYAIGPLSCLSCLPVTLVYCGQTVGLIKMPLGMEVDLGPGDIVLDGDPDLLSERGTAAPPHFSAHVLWLNGCPYRPSQQLLSSCKANERTPTKSCCGTVAET